MVLKDIREHQKWERASFLRSEVSGGLTQFLRYYSTLFPSVRISGNQKDFKDFRDTKFFFVKCDNSTKNISAKELWNAGIPAYQGNSAQRHSKISKKYRGSRRYFSVSPPSPTTYSPGAWSLLDQERARLATSLLCSNMKRTSIQNEFFKNTFVERSSLDLTFS